MHLRISAACLYYTKSCSNFIEFPWHLFNNVSEYEWIQNVTEIKIHLGTQWLQTRDEGQFFAIVKFPKVKAFQYFLYFEFLNLYVLTYFLDCGNRNFSFKNLMDHDTIKRIQKKNFCKWWAKTHKYASRRKNSLHLVAFAWDFWHFF